MLTKGAIGNLVNRYKAVLTKCNLINTFGSLAVASMLVLGGAGVAGAEAVTLTSDKTITNIDFFFHPNTNTTSNDNGEYIDTDLDGFTLTINNPSGVALDNVEFNTGKTYLVAIGRDIENGSVDIKAAGTEAIHLGTVPNKEHSIIAKNINIESDDSAIYVIGSNDSSLHNSLLLKGQKITISGGTTSNAIQVEPNNHFKIYGESVDIKSGRTALRTAGNTTVEIKAKNLTITTTNDARYAIESETSQDKMTIDVQTATFNGNLEMKGELEGNGQFKLNGQSNNFEKLSNTDGGAIEFVVNNEATKINIEKNTAENLGVTGTAALTDALGGDVTKLANQINIKESATDTTLKLCESDIYGESTAKLTEDGVDTRTIKQSRNTLMDAALQQASVTTVALDKILTNDVRKRLGDIRSDKNTTGVWMRWDGGKLSGNGLSNDFNTIQIGGDTKVGKNCRLGVAGTFTHGDAEFARGTAELEGFTFATYATWMGENGMFADVVARLGQFSNEMKVEGRTGDMDNRVFSLSGEYGWRLPVCDQFFVEPQAELSYTYVSSDDLQLGESKYQFDSVDSLTGRAGLVAGWNLPEDRGNVYARASVVHQFMGDAKITGTKGIAHNVQELDGNDTWLEYGIGANVKLTDKTYLWADVERTEGAEIDEEWRGTVGIRYSF